MEEMERVDLTRNTKCKIQEIQNITTTNTKCKIQEIQKGKIAKITKLTKSEIH